nr:glutaminyl-tRNA synthetase [Theileria orientalis]
MAKSASPVNSLSTNMDKLSVSDSKDQTNFILQIVEEDIRSGKHKEVVTRFPPEPNGFLHIGHAKSICLNFELSKRFGGRTHLRFDDTNPLTEEVEYIESIKNDVRWLGYDWGEHLYYASDYFDQLYEWAIVLIKKGLAYVDDQSVEEIRATRGSLTEPGVESPYRNRSIEENLDLFEKMKDGHFPDGKCVLRAKIDMSSSNMNMRDPILYRIIRSAHPNTGDKWIIYPMYDFVHGQSDSIEGITHSICTTEFELHRPLYEWFQEMLDIPRTRQIEFARLNLSYCVMSKRLLLHLVNNNMVAGWDDPRMPTISGLRRRGCTPESIRNFCSKIGLAKRKNTIQIELLENCIRDSLNKCSKRFFAILDPLLVEIENLDDTFSEVVEVNADPDHKRKLTFCKHIYVDRKDFSETPSSDFYRLYPGNEVRLFYTYWIKCTKVVKNGDVVEKIICEYDPKTKGGKPEDSTRKVKATIHWMSKHDLCPATFRWYSRLFTKPDPKEGTEGELGWLENLNKESLKVYRGYVEKKATEMKVGDPIQFERTGYFTKDPDSTESESVFNLTITLVDALIKNLGLIHNTVVLAGWLYVELLVLYVFHKHLYNGKKIDFRIFNKINMWRNVSQEYKIVVLANSLNLLFLPDSKRERKEFMWLLFSHSKAALMYFVAFKLLGEDANRQWSMMNLLTFKLLSLVDTLNRFSNFVEQKIEFLEWLHHMLFMVLYPLITLSEMMLVTSSFKFLKRFDRYKLFPSPMPNRYNFYVNLHHLYRLLPGPMFIYSAIFYFTKCKHT